MNRVFRFLIPVLALLTVVIIGVRVDARLAPSTQLPDYFPFVNESGLSATVSESGGIDLANPFFKSLGSNGRACVTCHGPDQGWSISAAGAKARFALTAGLHPLFRTNDGSNCNHHIDVSSLKGRKKAYTLLLDKGLIRVALAAPANAEFEVVNVANPYGCSEKSPVSVYRRPLPSTNLRFLTTVMWDGRESTPPQTEQITYVNGGALRFDLAHQAAGATLGHAGADAPPTQAQIQQIVDFEIGLYTTQMYDHDAGWLMTNGAKAGPHTLAAEPFFVGMNDRTQNPFGTPFSPEVFSLFAAWKDIQAPGRAPRARERIARGEQIFNTKTFNVTGVGGLNDAGRPGITTTCSGCHNAPNAGHRSVDSLLDIGVSDPSAILPPAGLPVITLRHKTTGAVVRTTDPGRALITGKWADMNKMKVPALRGLASRAPFFHNGSAATLLDLVEFYDQRFQIGLTAREKADLAAFLSAL